MMYNFSVTSEITTNFERQIPNETALVVDIGLLENLDKLDFPKVKLIIESLGLDPETFLKLLKLDFVPTEDPVKFLADNDNGQKIEDLEFRVADSPLGPIEVCDVLLHKEVVAGRDDTGLHLKVGKLGGFEAIYVLEGKATLAFLENVSPVAIGVYGASKERQQIELKPGMLAIIPAPTANGWSFVGEGFKFRYICQPPRHEDFVAPALDL